MSDGKDVNDGHITDDYKRHAVDLVASSGRSIGIGGEGTWACVIRYCAAGSSGRGAGREPTAAPRLPTRRRRCRRRTRLTEIARLQRENEQLRMERDILKKSIAIFAGATDMRFRFIEDRRADYPVRVMCRVLEVSPAGYYAWRSRPESPRSVANRELVEGIRRVHRDNRGRYGSPRIHAELKARDHSVSRGRIER